MQPPDESIRSGSAERKTLLALEAPSILPMPGFADRISDDEVAQLATFLRQGWSNTAGKVSAEQVRSVRMAGQAH